MEPLIRFSDFNNGWESTSLGNLFKERNERNSNKELLSVTMHQGVIKANANGRHNNSSDDRSSYKYVEKGDIAYNSMRMWQGACGCSKYEGIVSPAYTVIIPSASIVPDFFIRLFKSKKTLKKFRLNSQGLTSDTWNLKYQTLSKILVDYPCSHIEQQAISDYFDNIDTLIANTSARLASLKQMKEASLQAMFPQEGETVPKIRFKGFDGEWKKVMLEDCLFVNNQKNIKEEYDKNDVLSVSDDFGICNQIELLGRSYAGVSVANYGIVKTGDIVYTKSPLKSKPFGIIKANHGKSGIVSTLYAVYTPCENTSAKYIELYFELPQRMNKYIHPLVNKGAKNDMKVSSENALKGYIMIPNLSEQQKIASFFTILDKQISIQTQRLEKLKQIKAACLDKMFV